MLKQFLKEPLIHFLGGALLVFAFFWASGSNRDPADYSISISQQDISRLEAGWRQNFRRPPTDEELGNLIDQEITEEIYYREALRLGLDQGDPVIRRRLFTKMRFLNNEEADGGEPADAVLQKWMNDNPGKYTLSPLYNLDQIYLGQGDTLSAVEIENAIKQLNGGAISAADIAQPLSLPTTVKAMSAPTISRQFGEQFAAALASAEPGRWEGPIPSGFGMHLVKITDVTPGEAAALDDVRRQVSNDWRAAQTEKSEKRALNKYKAQYDIKVAGRE